MRIVFVFLIVCLGSAVLPAQDPALQQLLTDYLKQQDDFSGVVMVARAGQPVFMRGYGTIAPDSEDAISPNTLFDLGSIAKPFTATGLLTLAEAGKLNTSDYLGDYFDDLPDDKATITIHQLLTHSSGLPGALGPDYEAVDRDKFLDLVAETELLFEPGSSYEYSNVGYSLLAMLIEDLSGKSYDTYLRENLLQPVQMLMTGYSPTGVDYMPQAHGILADGSDWGTPRSQNWDDREPYWHLKGNGGLLSSASDMYRFYLALRDDKFLGGRMIKEQYKPHVSEGGGSYYGYGWAITEDGRHIQHNGGNGIFRADFHWLPREDVAVFVASNAANVRLFRISEAVLEIARTGEMPYEPEFTNVSLEDFPTNARQQVADRFFALVQEPDATAAAEFVSNSFSAGVIERNGADRLVEIFDMLHNDHPQLQLTGVKAADSLIALETRSEADGPQLVILLRFLEDQIDGIEVEMQ